MYSLMNSSVGVAATAAVAGAAAIPTASNAPAAMVTVARWTTCFISTLPASLRETPTWPPGDNAARLRVPRPHVKIQRANTR